MKELEILRRLGTVKMFAKDQTVFSQYEDGAEMFIVLKGMFGVYINSFTGFQKRVAGIKQGSFFGEMAIIDGSPRSATIISEEEGAVVVIGKGNFWSLLEQAPGVAEGIVKTLVNRATATAAAIRESGREAPEMPGDTEFDISEGAQRCWDLMTTLADCVRRMNEFLVSADDSAVGDDPETTGVYDTVKLLPEGYKKYNKTDFNDNRDNLRVMNVVCPYCHKALKAYTPVFGNLGKRTENLDGRVIYSDFNILLYTNTVCPNCNFADTYMEYSKPREPLSPPKYKENQFENLEKFKGYDRSQNRTFDEAIMSYYLNIDCLKRTSGDPLRFANAWIRLHWLYNDLESTDFARHAAKQAHHYYSRYSEQNEESLTINDKMQLNAILGEMSAVNENYANASEYYKMNTVICKDSKNELMIESKKRYKELSLLA